MTNDLKQYNKRKTKKLKKIKDKNKKNNMNLYEFEDGQVDDKKNNKNIEKIKNNKKFVKRSKKNVNKSELEDDVAIKMTNKNRIRQEEIKRKKMIKKNKKNNVIKKIIKRILIIVTFLGILIGSIIFLITSPIFNIGAITVTGNNSISEVNIVNLSQFELGTNMFSISKIKAKYLILQNPYIENVNINRNFPNEIEIWIEERIPKFVIFSNDSLAYIDLNTYVLEKNCDNSLGLITILGLQTTEDNIIEGKQLSQEDIDIFNELYEILNIAEEYELTSKITSINISNDDDYYFNLGNDGIDVYIGDNTNIGTKMMYITAIMEENIGNSGTIFVNGDFNDNFRAYFRKDV